MEIGGIVALVLLALLAAVLVVKNLSLSKALVALRKEADHMRLQLRLQREEESKRVKIYRRKIDALRGAVEQGAIRTVFQPVVNLSTGKVVGTEALSRFADDRGPETWFKEAAQLGIEVQLELAAIDRALGQLDRTHEGFISLNVSPSTIASKPFLDSLRDCGVPFHKIVVEITEHAVIENYDKVQEALRDLRRLGIRLAVDDVGAGFASLRHVLQLHPDIVKLDRSLVCGLNADNVKLHMVTALARVAQQMDATVIAEGIEESAEARALWSIGIEFGQGFLLQRPAEVSMAVLAWDPQRA